MENNPAKLWTTRFLVLIMINLLIQTINNMTNTTMAKYVAYIGGNNILGGFAITAFTIAALLTRPFAGGFSDKRGKKGVLIIGTVTVLAACLFYNFSHAIYVLILVRFIHGAGFSGNTTATGAIAPDIIPPSKLSEGIGYYGISSTFSSAVGPMLALFLIDGFGYPAMFACLAVLALLALICSLSLKLPPPSVKEPSNFFVENKLIACAAVIILVALSTSSVLSFLSMHAGARGIQNPGVFFSVTAVFSLVVRFFSGRIADRKGISYVIIPSMIILICALLLISRAASMPIFLLAAVFYGISNGTVGPSLNAIMIKLSSPDKRGAASAVYWASMDIGIGTGAIVWGTVAEKIGFGIIYLLAAFCVMAAIAAYLTVLSKQMKAYGVN